jgi:hypothetical protein
MLTQTSPRRRVVISLSEVALIAIAVALWVAVIFGFDL